MKIIISCLVLTLAVCLYTMELGSESEDEHQKPRLTKEQIERKRSLQSDYYDIVHLPPIICYKNQSSGLFQRVTEPMLVKIRNLYIIGRVVENHLRPLFKADFPEQMVKIKKDDYYKILPLSREAALKANMNGLMIDIPACDYNRLN